MDWRTLFESSRRPGSISAPNDRADSSKRKSGHTILNDNRSSNGLLKRVRLPSAVHSLLPASNFGGVQISSDSVYNV